MQFAPYNRYRWTQRSNGAPALELDFLMEPYAEEQHAEMVLVAHKLSLRDFEVVRIVDALKVEPFRNEVPAVQGKFQQVEKLMSCLGYKRENAVPLEGF